MVTLSYISPDEYPPRPPPRRNPEENGLEGRCLITVKSPPRRWLSTTFAQLTSVTPRPYNRWVEFEGFFLYLRETFWVVGSHGYRGHQDLQTITYDPEPLGRDDLRRCQGKYVKLRGFFRRASAAEQEWNGPAPAGDRLDIVRVEEIDGVRHYSH